MISDYRLFFAKFTIGYMYCWIFCTEIYFLCSTSVTRFFVIYHKHVSDTYRNIFTQPVRRNNFSNSEVEFFLNKKWVENLDTILLTFKQEALICKETAPKKTAIINYLCANVIVNVLFCDDLPVFSFFVNFWRKLWP